MEMGLGVGRLNTSIWPWIRELDIIVLLLNEDDNDEDDEEEDEFDLMDELFVAFFSYMSLKLREVYLLVLAIHHLPPPPIAAAFRRRMVERNVSSGDREKK